MQDNPGRIVTKYQFSSISIAWYKAIKPETIVSGFRKAGNAQAITIPEDVSLSATTEEVPSSVTVQADYEHAAEIYSSDDNEDQLDPKHGLQESVFTRINWSF